MPEQSTGPRITTITGPTYGRTIPEHATAEGQEILMADPKYKRMAENLFHAKKATRRITNADINEIVKHVALQANLDKAMKEHGMGFNATLNRALANQFKPSQTRRIGRVLANKTPNARLPIKTPLEASDEHMAAASKKPAPPRGLGMLHSKSEFIPFNNESVPNATNAIISLLSEPLTPVPATHTTIRSRPNTSKLKLRPLGLPMSLNRGVNIVNSLTPSKGRRLFKPIAPANQLAAYVAPPIKSWRRREGTKATRKQAKPRANSTRKRVVSVGSENNV